MLLTSEKILETIALQSSSLILFFNFNLFNIEKVKLTLHNPHPHRKILKFFNSSFSIIKKNMFQNFSSS